MGWHGTDGRKTEQVNQSTSIEVAKTREREELAKLIESLPCASVRMLHAFSKQIAGMHDLAAVEAFLEFRADPVLGSILEMAAKLDADARDQILFSLEDHADAIQRSRIGLVANVAPKGRR